MGIIRRRPAFVSDLRDVWKFIARDSEENADRFIRELNARFVMLSDNPGLGANRFPNYPAFRLFVFRNYLIVYEPIADGSGIELIRFLHAARDYHRFFED